MDEPPMNADERRSWREVHRRSSVFIRGRRCERNCAWRRSSAGQAKGWVQVSAKRRIGERATSGRPLQPPSPSAPTVAASKASSECAREISVVDMGAFQAARNAAARFTTGGSGASGANVSLLDGAYRRRSAFLCGWRGVGPEERRLTGMIWSPGGAGLKIRSQAAPGATECHVRGEAANLLNIRR